MTMTSKGKITRYRIKTDYFEIAFKYIYIKDEIPYWEEGSDKKEYWAAIIYKYGTWYPSAISNRRNHLIMRFPCRSEEFALQYMRGKIQEKHFSLIIVDQPIELPEAVAKMTMDAFYEQQPQRRINQ